VGIHDEQLCITVEFQQNVWNGLRNTGKSSFSALHKLGFFLWTSMTENWNCSTTSDGNG
jgi:hypothetical protein